MSAMYKYSHVSVVVELIVFATYGWRKHINKPMLEFIGQAK